MAKWSKIDWYCSDCGDYWMTTENCAPCAQLNCWCHCSCRNQCKGELKPEARAKSNSIGIPKCQACGHDLQQGKDLCAHFERSQAI